MSILARLQRLERELSLGSGPDARARQAWLRGRKLPERGDRLAPFAAIYTQAGESH